MTEADIRALTLLVAQNGVLIGPGAFGDYLWGKERRSGNCSCPYARIAGKVLNRLKSLGYSERIHESENWGWRSTIAGDAFVRSYDATKARMSK